jgi:hypothetical protein
MVGFASLLQGKVGFVEYTVSGFKLEDHSLVPIHALRNRRLGIRHLS